MVDPIDLDMERRKRDRSEGLEEDLHLAVGLMVKVVNGRQTVEEMGRWISLNYPEYRNNLPEILREVPPKD